MYSSGFHPSVAGPAAPTSSLGNLLEMQMIHDRPPPLEDLIQKLWGGARIHTLTSSYMILTLQILGPYFENQ